ncbi:MAG: hypothetical protein AVDCRST_MAG49-4022, partial [uncultured Thermomicrobiales bacterium]
GGAMLAAAVTAPVGPLGPLRAGFGPQERLGRGGRGEPPGPLARGSRGL